MRARNIKPGFYKNEDLAECSVFARFIFPGLWMMADREGRLEYRPKRIKAELLPFDSADVAPLLDELIAYGLLKKYTVDGVHYLWIPGFKKHQVPHYKEQGSVLPPHDDDIIEGKTLGIGADDRPIIDQSSTDDSSMIGGQTHLNPSSLNPSSLNPDSKAEDKDSSLRSESSCPGSDEPDEQIVEDSPAQDPGKESESEKPKRTKAPKSEPQFGADSEAYRLAVFMRDELKDNLPTFREPNLQTWAAEFDKALRNDTSMREPRVVAQVIRWVARDGFWRGNCQCPGKLRKQFDQLTAKMEAESAKARASPSSRGEWKSTAQRRLESNMAAGREAKRLLFGDSAEREVFDHATTGL